MASTHVDDIFVLFNLPGEILRNKLFENILSGIPIENLGNVSWALKTSILRDRVSGILKISQEQYTQEYLAKSIQGRKQFPVIKSPPSNHLSDNKLCKEIGRQLSYEFHQCKSDSLLYG